MFGKKTNDLEFKDLEYLVNNRKQQEGYNLDYKKSIGNPDKAKNVLAKDISSFANSGGGFLIIGIDDNLEILGVDRIVNNKSIDEWINQVVSSNIEPNVFYLDPKLVEIPKSEKVIVVIEIPESTKKPHIVKELYNYFIRINDSSKKANHSQVRDMFEFSRNRTNEFNEFLKQRNLENIESSDFGQNQSSKTLFSKVKEHIGQEKPLVLFSLVPKYPNEEKVNLPFNELQNWLQANSNGYEPDTSFSLYFGRYDYDLKLDGVVLKNTHSGETSSYFEILNNGFVEAGFSSTLTYNYQNHDKKNKVAIYLTQIIAYEMLLLNWAKKFYDFIKYYDEILFQLSFVNVKNLKLYGFNEKYRDIHRYERSEKYNLHHNNFKLNFAFRPKEIDDDKILEIAKIHSEKICRAFGLEKDYGFVDNKISTNELRHFYL